MTPHAASTSRSPGSSLRSPTIKGVFVNAHIEAVRRVLGPPGVEALEERFGAPLRFGAGEDVPVRDEVRIIECALDLTADPPVATQDRAYEAGRLHFRNFSTTPWARLVFGLFPRNYRYMTLHARTIAERVFKGVRFEAQDLGPTAVRITMSNNDYPIDHFRGLFHEWMEQFGYEGDVTARARPGGVYEYTLSWR